MKIDKTVVMKLLDKRGIEYTPYVFDSPTALSAEEVAAKLGKRNCDIFKTLVTVGKSGTNYVFILPAGTELDLKKAAKSVNEKSIEMIKSKDLLPLTGYIHGGCSPIGMKKTFMTTIDSSCKEVPTITVSAGALGRQIELTLDSLAKVLRYQIADITADTTA